MFQWKGNEIEGSDAFIYRLSIHLALLRLRLPSGLGVLRVCSAGKLVLFLLYSLNDRCIESYGDIDIS